MLTIPEMIRKYNIRLHGENQIAVPGGAKLSRKVQEEIKAAKSEIIAELKRREQEKAEAEARRQAEREAEKQAILSGGKPIQLQYHDGEYLSDWEVVGVAVDLLQELNLVKYISGWGYVLIDRAAKELGHEFAYRQAADLAGRIQAEKAAAQAAKEAERQAKFAEARETGKPVLLKKWTTGCCDPREECDVDIHYEYAQPDGTVRHEWHHTW